MKEWGLHQMVMTRPRMAAHCIFKILAISLSLSWIGNTQASFETGKLIEKSPRLEQIVSHILVGKLIGYHQIKDTPHRFVAEVEISDTDKGKGVQAGDILYIRFTSPSTLEQLQTERMVWDCGDQKLDPLPGEWARVYTRLDENFEYLADHPSCFFSLGRKKPETTRNHVWNALPNGSIPISTSCLILGFGAGFLVRAKRSTTLR